MDNQNLKEKVNFILFECQNRQMKDDEKDLCKIRIEQLKDEIKCNENEILWIYDGIRK